MSIIFLDKIISLSEVYDYTQSPLIEMKYNSGENINIDMSSNGFDDILSYLQGVDAWQGEITSKHISLVEKLEIIECFWMIRNQREQDYRFDIDGQIVMIVDMNGRECMSRIFSMRILSQFIDPTRKLLFLKVSNDQDGINAYRALEVYDMKLSLVNHIDDLDIEFPMKFKYTQDMPILREGATFLWHNFLITGIHTIYDLKTRKLYDITANLIFDEDENNIIVTENSITCIFTYDDELISNYRDDGIFNRIIKSIHILPTNVQIENIY